LRGLPPHWEQRIVESAVDGLLQCAMGLARALEKQGGKAEAQELRRRTLLLERTDELHRHASSIETLVGLYRALRVFGQERDPALENALTWVQSGAFGEKGAPHGPAFRETAALRNRAFRLVAAGLAKYSR
jgi:hypothetical protein